MAQRGHGYRTSPVALRTAGRAPEGQDRAGYLIRNLTENETGASVTEVWLYDMIGGWFGINSQDVVRELLNISTDEIRVRINSPGGSVFEGIAIMNALASHPGPVHVVVDSLCASIATAIAMSGDTITMSPGSQMMIHCASGVCMGDADDMRGLANVLDFQSSNIAALYAARAGGDPAEWLDAMRAETWLTADEAVDAGLADAIGVVKRAPADASVIPGAATDDDDWWDLSEFKVAGQFKFAGRDKAPEPGIAAHARTVTPRPKLAAVPTPPADEAPENVTPLPAGDTTAPAETATTDHQIDSIADALRAATREAVA